MPSKERASAVFDKLPPYYIKEKFFGSILVTQLLEYVSENEAFFEASRVRSIEGRVEKEIRISSIFRDFGSLKDEIKARFNAEFVEALQRLKMPMFDLCGTEREIVAHGDGAYYNRHIDTATGSGQFSMRALSAVYYFHRQPRKFEGGNLRLLPLRFSSNESNYLDIEPVNDRLLVFPSWLPHQVMPVISSSGEFKDSRFAINCWYHRLRS